MTIQTTVARSCLIQESIWTFKDFMTVSLWSNEHAAYTVSSPNITAEFTSWQPLTIYIAVHRIWSGLCKRVKYNLSPKRPSRWTLVSNSRHPKEGKFQQGTKACAASGRGRRRMQCEQWTIAKKLFNVIHFFSFLLCFDFLWNLRFCAVPLFGVFCFCCRIQKLVLPAPWSSKEIWMLVHCDPTRNRWDLPIWV